MLLWSLVIYSHCSCLIPLDSPRDMPAKYVFADEIHLQHWLYKLSTKQKIIQALFFKKLVFVFVWIVDVLNVPSSLSTPSVHVHEHHYHSHRFNFMNMQYLFTIFQTQTNELRPKFVHFVLFYERNIIDVKNTKQTLADMRLAVKLRVYIWYRHAVIFCWPIELNREKFKYYAHILCL